MEKITFCPDEETGIDFYVIEQTVIGGKTYILVSDTEKGDGDAYILRDDSDESDSEADYFMVEDETELKAVGDIFAKLLDDDGIELDL